MFNLPDLEHLTDLMQRQCEALESIARALNGIHGMLDRQQNGNGPIGAGRP